MAKGSVKAKNDGDGRHGKPAAPPPGAHASHGTKGNEGKHYA